mgnify:CR=1 FL=1
MNLFDMPGGVPSLIKIGEISSIDPAKCTCLLYTSDAADD